MPDVSPPALPWWVTAAIAALVSMALVALALFLPLGRATIVLVVGGLVFVLVLLKNPAFWRRRLAGTCIGAAIALAAAPSFRVFLDLDRLGYVLLDGGASVVLLLLLAIVGLALAVLEHLAERPPTGPRSLTAGQSIIQGDHNHISNNTVGNDFVARDKIEIGSVYHGPVTILGHGEDPPKRENSASNGAAPARALLSNIPRLAHPMIGRQDRLADIDAALARQGAAALVQSIAVTGLGGIGKTRIALEYAHTRAEHYDVRWWTYGHRLNSDLADLARALGVSSSTDDVDRAAAAARDYLQVHGRWLLVIDNADDPDRLRDLLPRLGPGHVLVTSRAAAWSGAIPIEITSLPPDDARRLLVELSGRPDESGAADLAHALGYLPLALVQAAAYLRNTRDTVAAYQDLLRRDGLGLFKDRHSDPDDPLLRDPADTHRRSVESTWRPNIAAVLGTPDIGPAAAELLNVFAFLDPDGVSCALLSVKPRRLPWLLSPLATDARRLNDALALLLRYSLLERDGDRVRVHRLVQQVTRDALPAERRQALPAQLVIWARAVFAYNPRQPWVSGVPAGIVPQLLALGERGECIAVAGSKLSHALGDLSHYLLLRGDVATALQAGRRARDIAEAMAHADPHSAQAQRDLSISLNKLGDVEVHAGNLAAARDLFQRSLKIAEALAKADSHSAQAPHDLSVSLIKLGDVEVRAGNLTAARDLFQRSLSVREVLAKATPHSAQAQRNFSVSLNNLGDVEVTAGNLTAASDLYQRDLAIAEALAKADPHSAQAQRDLSISFNKLGDVEVHAGNLAAARDLFQRSSEIREGLAKADPHSAQAQRDLSVSLNKLGDVAVNAGNLAVARNLFQRSAEIREGLAKADPHSAQAQRDLADSWERMAKVDRAHH